MRTYVIKQDGVTVANVQADDMKIDVSKGGETFVRFVQGNESASLNTSDDLTDVKVEWTHIYG